MTSPLALFASGASGLPPATPVEFASLVLPRSPNTCLAAPASHPGFKHIETPLYPMSPAALIDRLLRLADNMPRTTRMAHWAERHQAQWVERTPLMNYPDIIMAEAAPAPGGASLFLYSRSLLGYHDLGVNRARVVRWLAALAAPG